jgi:hypothetical protein
MNSATSTDAVRLKPDVNDPAPCGDRRVRVRADYPEGLQPWQFFVLAALVCATVVTYMVRGQGVTIVLLLSVLMATTALVGLAVLRTVRPLVTGYGDRTPMVGERTRAALEREKALALRTLKELEFDRAMKKISDDDYREMSTRLRARATRIIQQLDAGAGHRARIEADLAKRLSEREAGRKGDTPGQEKAGSVKAASRACPSCSTSNDADARFCKECGGKL